jgi:ATP-dependent DNA ligase
MFYDLLFRREWPHFVALDALTIDGEDLRDRPLLERKRRLRAVMPRPRGRNPAAGSPVYRATETKLKR